MLYCVQLFEMTVVISSSSHKSENDNNLGMNLHIIDDLELTSRDYVKRSLHLSRSETIQDH